MLTLKVVFCLLLGGALTHREEADRKCLRNGIISDNVVLRNGEHRRTGHRHHVIQAQDVRPGSASEYRTHQDLHQGFRRKDVYKTVDYTTNYTQHKGTFLSHYASATTGRDAYLDFNDAILLCNSLDKQCAGVTCEDPETQVRCSVRKEADLMPSKKGEISYVKVSMSRQWTRMHMVAAGCAFVIIVVGIVVIAIKRRLSNKQNDFQEPETLEPDNTVHLEPEPKAPSFQWTLGTNPEGTLGKWYMFPATSSGVDSLEPLEDRVSLPWSEDNVLELLRQNNIPVDTWIDGALGYLVDELIEEKAYLCIGTPEGRVSRRGNLLRVVEFAEVIVVHWKEGLVLVETIRFELDEEDEAANRAKFEGPGFGTALMPKTRRRCNESISSAATRCIAVKLGLPLTSVQRRKCCAIEEVEQNPNFHGLKTLVRKHMLAYEVTTTDSEMLAKVRLNPIGKWTTHHEDFEIGFKWMPLQSNEYLQNHLGWIEGGQLSLLSGHTSIVSPSLNTATPWREQDIESVLKKHGAEVSAFEGTIEDLECVLLSGEAYFATRRSDQKLLLIQDLVLLRAVAEDGAVLTQPTDAGPVLPNGVCRLDESLVTVAHRAILDAGLGLAALDLDLDNPQWLPGVAKRLPDGCLVEQRRIVFTAHVQRSDFAG